MCLNTSDIFLWGFEMSGGAGVAIQPIYGGGGNEIGPGRIEFVNKGIWFGGPNSSTENGGSYVNSVEFDFTGQNYDTTDFTTNHSAIEIDSGDGYTMNGDTILRPPTTDPSFKFGGTGANVKLKNVMVTGTIFAGAYGPGSQNSCMEINNGGDGTAPDFLFLQAICNPGNNAPAVKYNVIPTHFVEDTLASQTFTDSTHTGVGQHWERGRPWGIGDSPPRLT